MPQSEPATDSLTPTAPARPGNPDALPMVLMIDDNQYDIDLTRIAFGENGFDATFATAKDGEEGAQLIRRLATDQSRPLPDLILLDLNLPRMNGVGVLALIRAEPALKHIPVVVLTTSEFPADRQRCMALGASAFIIKSHRLHDFFTSIKSLGQYLGGRNPAPPASPPTFIHPPTDGPF